MKRLQLLLLLLLMVLMVNAQKKEHTYKVLYMNHPQILIDGRQAKVGVFFNENSIVTWAKDGQAMKIQDVCCNKRYVLPAIPKEKKSLTVLQILTRIGHLSTHAPGEDVSSFEKLESTIAPQYYLLDSIDIPTDITVDETHYFRGYYRYGDARIMKRLTYKDGCIIIDKTLFHVDDKRLDPRDISLSIDYVVKTPANAVFIKDDIKLIMVPEKLE